MATLRYNQWLQLVSLDDSDPLKFDVTKVDLNVMLVTDEYQPDLDHKPVDVDKYIVKGVSVIVDDFFSTHGIGDVIDEVKDKMVIGFKAFPAEIAKEVDRVFTDKTKAEKIKQLIQNPDNNFQLWKELKENGVGYFVFESPEHGSLCFCETIEM
jgi:hypothetical protein